MSLRFLLFIPLLSFVLSLSAQEISMSGKVTNEEGRPIGNVNVSVIHSGFGAVTAANGVFTLIAEIGDTLEFTHVQFEQFQHIIKDSSFLEILLTEKTIALSGVEIHDKKVVDPIINRLDIDAKASRSLPSVFGDFNKVLITLPGVSGNNELSSAYSVRGGNFDENLVYVNDIPIYRPFLSNAGRQEGLSFVNPDMVEDINFYSGGWEAKYGDKLSSSLNIQYKEPETLEGSATVGLLGGSAYAGGKLGEGSYLIGIRHRDSRYLLNSLETKGQYFPTYTDVQSLLNFDLSSKNSNYINKTKLTWLIAYGRNRYLTTPTSQLTDFGSVEQNFRLETAFTGREILDYDTYQSGIHLTHNLNNWIRTHVIASGLLTSESELYEVEGAYRLSDIARPGNPDAENSTIIRGIGSNYDYGRNQLSAEIYTVENRWEVLVKSNFMLEAGVGFSFQGIEDELNEYSFIDSADYVSISYAAFNSANIQSQQYTGYLQSTWYAKDSISSINLGTRANYWTLNNELLISPRITYRYAPKWEVPTSFTLSTGFYQQPPFYRELRNYQGELNEDVLAQKSIHVILGMNRALTMWGRPFILSTDVYYKYLYDVIPYDIDNVRIRFLSERAKAFATGLDFRINGEFIKGTQSWFSISYLQTKEDLTSDNQGYIRRPTDQHLNFAIYFEDHMPIDPTIQVYLNLVFGSGYPFGPPQNISLRNAFQGDEYYRADLGLSKQFNLKPERFLNAFWVRAEVLNALGADNTLSYTWIEDVNGNSFAIPNSLSARFLNIKLTVEL